MWLKHPTQNAPVELWQRYLANFIREHLNHNDQARIHTSFQRFTEIGQIFHNKYIFNQN